VYANLRAAKENPSRDLALKLSSGLLRRQRLSALFALRERVGSGAFDLFHSTFVPASFCPQSVGLAAAIRQQTIGAAISHFLSDLTCFDLNLLARLLGRVLFCVIGAEVDIYSRVKHLARQKQISSDIQNVFCSL